MIPTTAVSETYSWSSLPRQQGYELKLSGELVGTMRRPSIWKSNFEAEAAAEKWIFHRSGILGTGAEIVDAASSQPIASFRAAWAHRGLLTFSDGQTFIFHCKGLWHPTWSVKSQSDQDVLLLHTREKTAEVFASESLPETRRTLLMIFTLYRVLQAEEDAASAAMIAS